MKIALVDGYNLAFRSFYGMPELTRKDGFPTGAIHGWVKTLGWLDNNAGADRLLVFFDLGGAQRQLAIREDYKANRTETPVALEQQIPVIKAWTKAMGYGAIEKDGVEADDLIASYACQLAALGHEIFVVSADKDLCQLVTEKIHVLAPPPTANPRLGWRSLDPAGVEEKFGLPPSMIADYLALIGDTVDNIPGLKGVGPKTAVKWLRQYSNVESIIAHCGELQPKRFQAIVHAEQENLRQNQQMTRLDCGLPISELDILAESEPEQAVALLEQMEMAQSAKALRAKLLANG